MEREESMSAPIKFDLAGHRVFVAGHKGLAGSAIVRRLSRERCDVLTVDRTEVDLARQDDTERWLLQTRPDAIFLAAARVGGIHANTTYPADFIGDNLAIALNVIRGAHKAGVQKLLFLSSSCIYPRIAPQPMTEDVLLTGPLDPAHDWYGIAKIAGIRLCQSYRRQFGCDFVSVIPTNLYGPNDNYHPENGHVPAALIRRFHEAKVSGAQTVTIWGTGTPRREFLAADDLADACVFVMKHYSDEGILNVGTGEDITIGDFARVVGEVVGYKGNLVFDTGRPDGTPRKLLDVSRLRSLGWQARIELREGLAKSYEDFLARYARHEFQEIA
jgi:GDP-L-fucose synthase